MTSSPGQSEIRPHVTPPASGSSSGRAEFSADALEAEYAAGFLSGRRSMQEEAAKAAETPADWRIAERIRALNPETKP